jgi:hypothetical protein
MKYIKKFENSEVDLESWINKLNKKSDEYIEYIGKYVIINYTPEGNKNIVHICKILKSDIGCCNGYK